MQAFTVVHGAFQGESRLQNFCLKIQQHGNQNKYNSKKFLKKTLEVSRDQAMEGTETCICALNSRVLAKDKDRIAPKPLATEGKSGISLKSRG